MLLYMPSSLDASFVEQGIIEEKWEPGEKHLNPMMGRLRRKLDKRSIDEKSLNR